MRKVAAEALKEKDVLLHGNYQGPIVRIKVARKYVYVTIETLVIRRGPQYALKKFTFNMGQFLGVAQSPEEWPEWLREQHGQQAEAAKTPPTKVTLDQALQEAATDENAQPKVALPPDGEAHRFVRGRVEKLVGHLRRSIISDQEVYGIKFSILTIAGFPLVEGRGGALWAIDLLLKSPHGDEEVARQIMMKAVDIRRS